MRGSDRSTCAGSRRIPHTRQAVPSTKIAIDAHKAGPRAKSNKSIIVARDTLVPRVYSSQLPHELLIWIKPAPGVRAEYAIWTHKKFATRILPAPAADAAVNYLAHAFLSCHSPEAVIGALLGDFVKGPVADHHPPAVRAAIQLHRAIDRYTDEHPIVRASRALVSPARRRFAGVLVDVFYDHFLARDFARYSATPLEDFTQRVYEMLARQRETYPERMQRLLPRMVATDWLASYARLESVDAALNGIARRLRRFPRAQVLTTAVEELEREYPRFRQHFHAFFPEVLRFVEAQRSVPHPGQSGA